MSIFGADNGSIFGLTERVSLDTKIEVRDATLNAFPAAVASWFADVEGTVNSSGESINYRTALAISTVYTCIRVLCEYIATLPLLLYELIGNGHEQATDHPLYWLLTVEPNPNMTAISLIECIVASLGLAGNAYVEIERNDAGQAIALWPLHPRHTEPKIRNGQLVYQTTDGSDGEHPGSSRIILKEDILHIPLFSLDGVKGCDPITYNRQSLGLAKAAERQAALWFSNNSMPTGGLLTNADPNYKPTPKQKEEFKEGWEATQANMQKGRIGILPGSWKFETIGLNAEQIQFLQLRQFQRSDIAAIYRLSPQQVGSETRQANSNKVQENLSFITGTLRPYLSKIEAEITRKLLPTTGRKAGLYKVRFDVSELQRGDLASTYQAYALGRQWSWLTVNDINRAEGRNIGGPECDVYIVPLNYVNAKALLANDEAAQAEQQTKQAVRHLIPHWRNAFDRVCTSDTRDFDTIRTAFTPVLMGITDAIGMSADDQNTTTLIDRTIRALSRRAKSWPETWEPTYTDTMGAEITSVVRQLPPPVIVMPPAPALAEEETDDED